MHGVEQRGGGDPPPAPVAGGCTAAARTPSRVGDRGRLPLPRGAAATRDAPGERDASRRPGRRDGSAGRGAGPDGHCAGGRGRRPARPAGERVLAARHAERGDAGPPTLSAVARLLAAALLAAAAFATWLAWIAYEVLCEEGCAGRPWPLVAQLVAAGCGLVLAAAAVLAGGRWARRLMLAAAIVYAAWA